MSMNVTIDGIELNLETEETLFSPSHPDEGTLLMLQEVVFDGEGRVLDLGCGYGIAGIYLAKKFPYSEILCSDIDMTAVRVTKKNIEENSVSNCRAVVSDGFDDLGEEKFSLILSNPPYHTDFSVAKGFVEGSHRHLETGGKLYMVTKRLTWYKNKLESVFGGCRVAEKNGYYIFMAQKRKKRKAKKTPEKTMSKKLERKYAKKKCSVQR